ncbi:MAG: double zinc ribbon domain-containing protein [Actinomycetota bacterium]
MRSLLDLVFPLRCAGCGGGTWPFCSACREALAPITPPTCARCGRPWLEPVDRCRDCPPPTLATARAPFLYEGPARSALYRLKFSGWRAVADALGAAMAAVDDSGAVAVTWVPLGRRRRAERGYDQARALARAVGSRLGLPVLPLLRRVADTDPQARRTARERRLAMRGAFEAVARPPPGPLLLVDDVLTTGATAAECAGVLRAAGARSVALLTAARAVAGPVPARCYARGDSRPGLWLPGDDLR